MSLRRSAFLSLLALVGLLALGALVSACTGAKEKNEASPCCGATGSVEQPPPAFALGGATFDGIRIRPVIYTTGGECASFDDPLDSLLNLKTAGPTVDVDGTTGVFELRLTEDALGRKVAFLACDEECDQVLGVGLLGAEVVRTAPGELLDVGPIRLVAPSGALGTSSLEMLADCELDVRGIRGGLVTADVRHVLSELVSYPAAPTADEVNDLMARLQLFDAAMQVARDGTGGQVAAFDAARADIEAIVDRCVAGDALPGCVSPSANDAELFRYYRIARLPFTVGPTPNPTATAAPGPLPQEDAFAPFILQTWAQQVSDKLGPMAPLPADTLGLSLLKQDAMFRHQIMEKAVQDASTATFTDLGSGTSATLSLTFTSAGLPSINQSMAAIRAAILAGSMDVPSSIYDPWSVAAADIGRNMDVQLGGTGNQTFQNLMGDARTFGMEIQATLDATSTPEEAFDVVYSAGDGTNGAYQKLFTAVGTVVAGHPLTEQLALTDILFFVGANATAPVTQGLQ